MWARWITECVRRWSHQPLYFSRTCLIHGHIVDSGVRDYLNTPWIELKGGLWVYRTIWIGYEFNLVRLPRALRGLIRSEYHFRTVILPSERLTPSKYHINWYIKYHRSFCALSRLNGMTLKWVPRHRGSKVIKKWTNWQRKGPRILFQVHQSQSVGFYG